MITKTAPVIRRCRLLLFAVGFVFFAGAATYSMGHHLGAFQAPSPKLTCDKPLIDLGRVQPNSKVACEFVIRNAGRLPLVVTDVKTGCGRCIEVIDFSKTPLRPGDAGFVRVRLLTGSHESPIVKGVTVCSNDPARPKYVLRVASK